MFLDDGNDGVTLARYDDIRYPRIEKILEKQLSFFWRPEEVDISRDRKDFQELSPHEQHIFTSNLKRQILLDSVQGRSPNLAFLPIVTLPEVETWIETWSFFETIHSRSYTHLIRNVYPNPSIVFDEINDIKEIVDCAKDISVHYNKLIDYNQKVELRGYGKKRTKYEHKKLLWLALLAVNILEGIRFYVSFACSWAFAEQKKMEGNAKIIKFICRDENVHLGSTQFMLTELPKEDPDFKRIREETKEEAIQMYIDAVEQEKEWAKYLFKDGSMIGLTEKVLADYVEWICCKRMNSINLKCPYTVPQANPLPWTEGWITGKQRQVAPQESEISSYVVGEIDKKVDDNFLTGLSL
jgi:ribonucleoside-diphosphate reductase beta chain